MVLIAGCEGRDDRLADFAEKANSQQAEQNRAVTELNREAVESHRRVAEAVEKSRQDITSLERDVQQQRQRLDEERRQISEQRQRDSLLVPVVETAGVLVVCSLPLVLAWYLLHGLRGQDDDVSEVLIHELVGDSPRLLESTQQRLDVERGLPQSEQDPNEEENADR
ncbi:MAG: hypothetical protein RIC55_19120 [Pirellulaceae bacterium]